jgi:hypothetical protein
MSQVRVASAMVFSCMPGSAPLVARGFNQHDAAGLEVDGIAGLG